MNCRLLERLLRGRRNWRFRSRFMFVCCVPYMVVSLIRREARIQWKGSVCVQRPIVSICPLAGRGGLSFCKRYSIHCHHQKKHPELSVTDITERLYVHRVTTSEDILSFIVAFFDLFHLGLTRCLRDAEYQTDRDRFHGDSLSSRCESCTSVISLSPRTI